MCSENKGADQLRRVTAKLICSFVFAYANCWFSHDAADISTNEHNHSTANFQ